MAQTTICFEISCSSELLFKFCCRCFYFAIDFMLERLIKSKKAWDFGQNGMGELIYFDHHILCDGTIHLNSISGEKAASSSLPTNGQLFSGK